MLSFHALGRSDPGCVRQVNEDAFLIEHLRTDADADGHSILAIVADGVGGHAQGEIASRESIRIIRDEVANGLFTNGPQVLKSAVEQAHRHLLKLAADQEGFAGMGTTCTVVWVGNSQAYVAQVGDSRAYLIRNRVAVQITEDQTLVQKLLKEGVITKQEAAHHPQKNLILQALGISENLEVELFHLPLKQNDTILLCTDGLHSLVDDSELVQSATENKPPQALENLINLAKQRGGFDNITAVIVRERSSEPEPSKSTTKEFQGAPLSGEAREPGTKAGHRLRSYLATLLVILLGLALFLLLNYRKILG